jgi:hypothetical protein
MQRNKMIKRMIKKEQGVGLRDKVYVIVTNATQDL